VIAGIVAALPVGLIWALSTFSFAQGQLQSNFSRNPTVWNIHTVMLVTEVGFIVVGLAFSACFGAIAGLFFVTATNKLPIPSTYVKAMIPVMILWSLFVVSSFVLAWLPNLARNYGVFLNYFIETLEALVVLFLGTSLFAYLFNRWSK
jgi:hypothetical protein